MYMLRYYVVYLYGVLPKVDMYTKQGRRQVWKSGGGAGGSSSVVDGICPLSLE